MAATMPASGLPDGSQGSSCCFGGNDRQHGRTAQVHVRAIARTNGKAGQKQRIPGHAASRKAHPRAERRRSTCFRGGLPSRGENRKVAPPLLSRAAAALCCKHRAPGVPIACRYTWRRGRGETPCVPHAPSGEKEQRRPACPAPDRFRERFCTSAAGADFCLARTGQARRALARQGTEAMTRIWTLPVARMA